MVTPELMVTSALLPLMSKSAQLEENDATVPLTSLQALGFECFPDVPDAISPEVIPEITELYVASVNIELECTPKLVVPETSLNVIFP